MGNLYYIVKDGPPREAFALNKVFHYDRNGALAHLDGKPIRAHYEDEAALVAAVAAARSTTTTVAWFRRIAERLFRWAGEAPVTFHSDQSVDTKSRKEDAHGADCYLITGSAHDEDNRDGHYIPGKAW